MAKAKASKSGGRETLEMESFRYADDLGIKLPSLVLGIEVDPKSFGSDYPPRSYRFKPGRQWVNLAHQTAGHCCHQRYLIGTVLSTTPAARLGMDRLAEEWLDSNAGCLGMSLVEVLSYRDNLKLWLGADCNQCFDKLEEGYYPIDTSFISLLAADTLPQDLDDLIDFETGFDRACGCIGRWSLVCVGPNCD